MIYPLLLILFIGSRVDSAKILCLLHVPSYSHFTPPYNLMKELAKKGHEVTVVGPYEEKESIENFRKISIAAESFIEDDGRTIFEILRLPRYTYIKVLMDFATRATKNLLADPKVKDLLNSDETFDAVVMEHFMSEALRGFCHRFKAPCIMYTSLSSNSFIDPLIGNPAPLAQNSDFFMGLPDRMSFTERLSNVVHYLYTQALIHFYYFPEHDQILKEHFVGAPDLQDLIYNNSLILINSHPSFSNPTPKLPNFVEIGGFHVRDPKPLPKDLQKFLDEATEGVIYFSMGSILKSKDFPTEMRQGILKAFSKVKEKVLWKFEDDKLEGQPENVKIVKWAPQRDLLEHPNVKLFITHGGLFSSIEAIHCGVPFIGIPIFGDQQANILASQNKGIAVAVNYEDISEKTLSTALNEILSNSSYRENIQIRSKLLRDQPVKLMENAIYWIEYVIRNKGAYYMQSAAVNLKWYQYHLLDVLSFITAILTIIPISIVIYKFH